MYRLQGSPGIDGESHDPKAHMGTTRKIIPYPGAVYENRLLKKKEFLEHLKEDNKRRSLLE